MPRFDMLSSCSNRSWLASASLVVVLAGCRSCGAEPPVPEVVKKTELEVNVKKPVKTEKLIAWERQRELRSKSSRATLRDIKMTTPDATEEARALTDGVKGAMTLVLKGGVGPATEARGLLTARLAAAPTDPDALYWMGRSYQAERIQVPAIEWYQRAVESDPGFVSAHRWLAYTFFSEGRCDEAKEHLDAAVTGRPDTADVLVDRGVCSVATGDIPAALIDLGAACTLEPFEWCATLEEAEKEQTRRAEQRSKLRAKGIQLGELNASGKLGKRGKLGNRRNGLGKFGKAKVRGKQGSRPTTEETDE